MCGSDFSVVHREEKDIYRHKETSKHKEYVDAAQRQRTLTNFGASLATANLEQKVVTSKLLFSGFLLKHNLPFSTAGHAAKIFRNMFPDSKIVKKYCYCHTKTTHTNDPIEELLLTRWYGLATDGSSDEDDKFLSALLRHVDKDSGLIVTSLLQMPSINSTPNV